MTSQRTQEAILAFARYRTSTAGQRVFERNFFDGHLVVACHAEDTISDVLERVAPHTPPVLLAVYFPSRSASRLFTFIDIEPSKGSVTADRPVTARVTSSIGLLADSVHGHTTICFDWQAWDAQTFELASA
ncbi:MAG: hypothetical protein ACRDQA_21635 [Nocardioidaceae bacterium]